MTSRMRSSRKNTVRDFPVSRANSVANNVGEVNRPSAQVDNKKKPKTKGVSDDR